ncbi:Spy/CpxP family protein refolding chaperone [Legionella saoudiensis]|uniref:Spy/CpxP family protein refolding chaperone n=1 Tax=Legionella saoudiensis TaxID=1750561 RepID=UPI00073196CC|nr:periplasmic heavy metal sensor [Legionella saoudiensis]
MNIKRLLLVNSCAFALAGASVVFAQTATENVNKGTQKQEQCAKYKSLSTQQRAQLQALRKSMRAEIKPLIKEKHAIRAQIKAAITAPNAQWNNVEALVAKSNEVNNKITMVVAKSRFDAFQKVGVLMPFRHHHRCPHDNKIAQQ